MKSESIILIGMAGVGKSTVGTSLSKSLGFNFIDLDDYILEKDGKTIQEVIDDGGEVRVEIARVLDQFKWAWQDYVRILTEAGFSRVYSVKEKSLGAKPYLLNVGVK